MDMRPDDKRISSGKERISRHSACRRLAYSHSAYSHSARKSHTSLLLYHKFALMSIVFQLLFFIVFLGHIYLQRRKNFLYFFKNLLTKRFIYGIILFVKQPMGICVMAAQQTLTLYVGVRISHPQPKRNDNFRQKIVVSFCSLHFSLFSFHSSLKLSFPEKR